MWVPARKVGIFMRLLPDGPKLDSRHGYRPLL
jgi:hypothetical protein